MKVATRPSTWADRWKLWPLYPYELSAMYILTNSNFKARQYILRYRRIIELYTATALVMNFL